MQTVPDRANSLFPPNAQPSYSSSPSSLLGQPVMSTTVDSLITMHDSRVVRFRDALIESESRRTEAEKCLAKAEAQITALLRRCITAESEAKELREKAVSQSMLEASIIAARNEAQSAREEARSHEKQAKDTLLLLRHFEQQHENALLRSSQETDALREEIRLLRISKNDLVSRVSEAERIKARAHEFDVEKRRLEATLQEAKANVAVLGLQLSEAQEKLQTATAAESQAQEKLVQSNKTIASLRMEMQGLQLRAQQWESMSQMYSRRFDGAREPLGVTAGATSQGHDDSELKKLSAQVKLAQELATSSQAEAQRSMQALVNANANLEKCENLNKQLTLSNTALQEKCASLEAELSTLAAANSDLKATIHALNCNNARQAEKSIESDVSRHRLVHVEHHAAQLGVQLREKDDEVRRLKESATQLASHLERLGARVCAAEMQQAECEAAVARQSNEVVLAAARELEAHHKVSLLEEQLGFQGSTTIVLLAAVANAENLALSATNELDQCRRLLRSAEKTVESKSDQIKQLEGTIAQTSGALNKVNTDLTNKSSDYATQLQRLREQAVAAEAMQRKLVTLEFEVGLLTTVVESQRFVANAVIISYEQSHKRLVTFAGETLDDSSFDEVISLVGTTSQQIRSIAGTFDSLIKSPPTFYATLSSSLHGGVQRWGRAALMTEEEPSTRPSLTLMRDEQKIQGRGLNDVVLLEALARCALISDEANAHRSIALHVCNYFARLVDHFEQLQASASLVQTVNEHAAFLYRGMKLLGLKQHRQASASASYERLERLNYALVQQHKRLYDVYWKMMDAALPQELRLKVRQELEAMSGQSTQLLHDGGKWRCQSCSIEHAQQAGANRLSSSMMVVEEKYEKEKLIEESSRLSRFLCDIEDRQNALLNENQRLMIRIMTLERAQRFQLPVPHDESCADGILVNTLVDTVTSLRHDVDLLGSAIAGSHTTEQHLIHGMSRYARFASDQVELLHLNCCQQLYDVYVMWKLCAPTERPPPLRISAPSTAVNQFAQTTDSFCNLCCCDTIGPTHQVIPSLVEKGPREPIVSTLSVETQCDEAPLALLVDFPHLDDSVNASRREAELQQLSAREAHARTQIVEYHLTQTALQLSFAMRCATILSKEACERSCEITRLKYLALDEDAKIETRDRMQAFAKTIDEYSQRLDAALRHKSEADENAAFLKKENKRLQAEKADAEQRTVALEQRYREVQSELQRSAIESERSAAALRNLEVHLEVAQATQLRRSPRPQVHSEVHLKPSISPSLVLPPQSPPNGELGSEKVHASVQTDAGPLAVSARQEILSTNEESSCWADSATPTKSDHVRIPSDGTLLTPNASPIMAYPVPCKSSRSDAPLNTALARIGLDTLSPAAQNDVGEVLAKLKRQVEDDKRGLMADVQGAVNDDCPSLTAWREALEFRDAALRQRESEWSAKELESKALREALSDQMTVLGRENRSVRFENQELRAECDRLLHRFHKATNSRRKLLLTTLCFERQLMFAEDPLWSRWRADAERRENVAAVPQEATTPLQSGEKWMGSFSGRSDASSDSRRCLVHRVNKSTQVHLVNGVEVTADGRTQGKPSWARSIVDKLSYSAGWE